MLTELLTNRSNSDSLIVEVVNPRPLRVKRNLRLLGISRDRITQVRSVEDFVSGFVSRAAQEVVAALRHTSDSRTESLLLTGHCIEHARKVVGLGAIANGNLELLIEDGVPPYTGPNISPAGKPSALTLGQLLTAVDNDAVQRLVVVTSTGMERFVVGLAPFVREFGAGDGTFQVLITAQTVAG
jgi:hypothetical protein